MVDELILAYMDATFAVHEVSGEDKSKEATSKEKLKMAQDAEQNLPMKTEEQEESDFSFDSRTSTPTESLSTASSPAKSAAAKSSPTGYSPTKRSRRTTSLDLLYQNIK